MSGLDPASSELSVPASGDPLSDALASGNEAAAATAGPGGLAAVGDASSGVACQSATPDASAAPAPPAADGAAGAAEPAPAAAAEPPAADAAPGAGTAQPPAMGASAALPATRTVSGALFTEDDMGPDWTEPEAWTQAADFIVQVHKQMPGELLHEAQRGLAMSALLVDTMQHSLDRVVEQLPCMGLRRHAEPASAPPQPDARADKP